MCETGGNQNIGEYHANIPQTAAGPRLFGSGLIDGNGDGLSVLEKSERVGLGGVGDEKIAGLVGCSCGL